MCACFIYHFKATSYIKKHKAVWPSGLRRLTRNQFSSEAHVRIMQPSVLSFLRVAGPISGGRIPKPIGEEEERKMKNEATCWANGTPTRKKKQKMNNTEYSGVSL
ncbi:hypothetical protein N7457_001649 [Penicillium paradoxum]|uniref:uncharacterized protein n=1 Tax=Penicillium paradoxum TaxID=176176 RepID=UPI00254974C4|nr:uncharacterized protein N7457_001649 [Penicillium paradoxum]KAJ5795050.1 hypothetical protein N7457_001649 [Penicillium paradoxum]